MLHTARRWSIVLLGLAFVTASTLAAQSVAAIAATVPEHPLAGAILIDRETQVAVIAAFFTTLTMEFVKRANVLPTLALNERTPFLLQRIYGVLIASIVAGTVHVQFQFDAAAGTAALTATGLAWPAWKEVTFELARQWTAQEIFYRKAVKDYRPERTL